MNPSSPPPFTIDQMDNFLTDNISNTWYDWGDHLLDINFDQLDFTDDHHQFTLPDPPLPLDAPPIPQQPIATVVESDRGGSAVERVRKRDPRLTCENFLAGMVPCACPELDAQMAEEEELEKEGRGKLVKKRPRTAAAVVSLKCQVPVCEADISELKGYHKRHRVCLRCANASEVVLDGQSKRYCQQCGKFHILPDFDEDKRSCRRKLEHHNRRRRRKSTDLRGVVDREIQADQPAEDIAYDDKAGKDNSCLSNQIVDEGVDSEDGRVSPVPVHESSQNNSQNIQSDSGVSFVTNSDAKTNGQKDSSHRTLSSSLGENRSSYSSLCPSGRISFKLYDWNPAEFPRRLRHQIFHWLKSMPVELEGYIRPGCTILTVFIAMPSSMWDKLSEDTSSYIHDFLIASDSMLFGRGPMVVYLNDTIFQVPKGGPSLMNVKVELRSPRLHYVHPTCFEAGKPMEFVLCGSNLLQPKFRFLISFAGKYLAYDYCVAISRESRGLHSVSKDIAVSCEHMMYKIYIPNTDPKLFGPAFVEVENESGISNFIPVLIADRHVCSEMQAVQQRFPKSLSPKGHQHAVGDPLSDPCEGFALRQAAISELLLDVAWLLKEPQLEDVQPLSTSSQIQRFNCLLDFLIQNKLAIILEKILLSLMMVTDFGQLCKPDIETSYADLKLFENYVERARQIVHQRCLDVTGLHSENSVLKEDLSSRNDDVSETRYMPNDSEDTDMSEEKMVGATTNFQGSSEAAPLINREVIMNVNCRQQVTILPQNSWHRVHSTRFMRSRQFLLVAGVTAMCFGVCAVVIHPTKVGELAVSLRRCLFGTPDL